VSSLGRYIFVQLLGPLGFITIALTGVVWLMQGLRFLDLIINKGLSLGDFLYLTLLLLPGFLTMILPIAMVCAVMVVYLRLEADSETIVMRAAGFGPWRFVMPALLLAGMVGGIMLSLTTYFAPAGYRTFKDMQFVVRNNVASILLQEGAFTQVVTGVTAYVRERVSDGELLGLLVHDARDPSRPVTIIAERGSLVSTADGPRFVLATGHRQELDKARGQLSWLYFDEYAFDLGGFAVAPETRWREGSERFLHELLQPSSNLDDIKNRTRFLVEAHRRLTIPLYPTALAAIALATLMWSQFSRRQRWGRVAVVALAAVLFELVGLGLVPILGRSPYLIPLLYVHGLAAIAGGLFLAAYPRRPLGRGLLARGTT